MATSQAALLIAQLQGQGYNRSQIALALGRDSSYVSQIASGKRTGATYIPALQNLVTGEKVVNVPRRTTKAGRQARVRQGAIRDTENRIINLASKSPNGSKIKQDLKSIEKKGGRIGAIVTFKKYQAYEMNTPAQMDIPIWSHGTSAKWINETMYNTGMSFSELLQQQIENAYSPSVAENIISVQINAVY